MVESAENHEYANDHSGDQQDDTLDQFEIQMTNASLSLARLRLGFAGMSLSLFPFGSLALCLLTLAVKRNLALIAEALVLVRLLLLKGAEGRNSVSTRMDPHPCRIEHNAS